MPFLTGNSSRKKLSFLTSQLGARGNVPLHLDFLSFVVGTKSRIGTQLDSKGIAFGEVQRRSLCIIKPFQKQSIDCVLLRRKAFIPKV